jgi:hypothetical protein
LIVACYSPLQAYRNPYDHAGPLLFSPPHSGLSASANIALSGLKIPCGQCIGCRLNLSGFGTAELHGHGFKKSFTEHGHVLGYMVVRADLTYSQGINRMWSRKTRFDFYWPAFKGG